MHGAHISRSGAKPTPSPKGLTGQRSSGCVRLSRRFLQTAVTCSMACVNAANTNLLQRVFHLALLKLALVWAALGK